MIPHKATSNGEHEEHIFRITPCTKIYMHIMWYTNL